MTMELMMEFGTGNELDELGRECCVCLGCVWVRVVSTRQDDWMSRETSYAVGCALDTPL